MKTTVRHSSYQKYLFGIVIGVDIALEAKSRCVNIIFKIRNSLFF